MFHFDTLKFFKSILLIFSLLSLNACATASKRGFQQGIASWYGGKFHGRKTASGESFNMHEMTAAHPTLAFGTRVKVVSQSNGRSVIVRINDRGPFIRGRIIDLSRAAATKLGLIQKGHDKVSLYLID